MPQIEVEELTYEDILDICEEIELTLPEVDHAS